MDIQETQTKNKPKDAKTLTSKMQNMSMKGKKLGKNRKFVVKSSLENPFTLEWPIISENHQQDIIQLTKDSFANMKKDESSKPPWSEVRKFKGKERRQFLADHKQNYQESLNKDPTAVEQRKQLIEDWAHVVLGYNAVMRGVEQNKLIGVLVKKDAQPPFLTKTFLPGCTNNGIPLIPIADLDTLLQDKNAMGLQHSCLVIGFCTTAAKEDCRFYNLISKMCEALNMDLEDVVGADDSESIVSGSDNMSIEEDNKENQVHRKKNYKMSDEEMSKYYLKRTNKKKRIFTPGEDKTAEKKEDDSLGFGSDFIGLGSTEIDIPNEPNSQLILIDRRGSNKETVQNSVELQQKKSNADDNQETSEQTICDSNVDLSSMESDNLFVLDSGGDDCDENASGSDPLIDENSDNNKGEKSKKIEDSESFNEKKRKKIADKMSPDQPAYIPAKVKRIKPNPNKK
ncbi:unnamed protein product [Meganyctiphanes norvegica]|uniref:Uncharacterized protein n=1 Tax=Meganyctiphanes norvegica TaxID=48144 RepID=A0AAV2R1K6_MEGNR